MTRPQILLLDVDGVLVLPPELFGSKLARLYPHLAQPLYTDYLAASVGQADLQELLPPLMAQEGITGTVDELLAEWFAAEDVPNLPLQQAVRELRTEGWTVFLATNQEQHRLRDLLEPSKLGALVDGAYASCTVGQRKPDPTYFAQVTADLVRRFPGLVPADVVFWDDMAQNVAAALEAGWTAFLYRDAGDFRERVTRLSRTLPDPVRA